MPEIQTFFKAPRDKTPANKRADAKRALAASCEARTPRCAGRPDQRHHTLRRSQGGGNRHTLDVCTPCHDYIHANTARAYDNGWLLHGWDAS